jgi:hypothetical protein
LFHPVLQKQEKQPDLPVNQNVVVHLHTDNQKAFLMLLVQLPQPHQHIHNQRSTFSQGNLQRIYSLELNQQRQEHLSKQCFQMQLIQYETVAFEALFELNLEYCC